MDDYIIDPGHGGIDPGAIGSTGLMEKDVTLKIALKVGKLLTDRGLHINYTRVDDKTLSLSARANIANNSKAKYVVSIHINAAENKKATGTESFSFKEGTEGEKLAKSINDNLVKAIGLPNRGVKVANFAILRETNMPAALTEVSFISNPSEEALLRDEAFIDKVAEGIARGMVEFKGQKWEMKDSIKAGLYRIRKVWTDAKSQVGAYEDLENAKEICDKNIGFSVFDNYGNKVYPIEQVEDVEDVKDGLPNWQLEGLKKLMDEKIIEDPDYWQNKFNEQITVGEVIGLVGRLVK